MKRYTRKIIGRRELVNFPDLNLTNVEAKIDTGAYTSSIHCKEVKRFQKEGMDYVSFVLLDPGHPLYENKPVEWPLHKIRDVKNSFGAVEKRCTIKTRLSFFEETSVIEISLADRSLMDYPLLLGRKAISKKFVVDVSKIHFAPKQKICVFE